MLKHLGIFRNAPSHKDEHPLADPKELQRALAELPLDRPYKALDEIVGWLESMQGENDLTGVALFEATRQLDEAAQTPLRRLAHDYLSASRLPRLEERRLWTICHGFHLLITVMYERCLVAGLQKNKVADVLKPSLPLIAARLVASLGGLLKWQQFQYRHGLAEESVWQRLGRALSDIENYGLAEKALMLYPNQPGSTTPQGEFVKVVAFQAASMDSLLPLEIEVAERLIAHFLNGFVFSAHYEADSVYWLDLALSQPPLRLARLPKEVSCGLRFFKPSSGHAQILALLHQIEQTGEVPADIHLGAQYSARLLIRVLRHLATYLASVPPQRSHVRHHVKHRMTVLSGMNNAFIVFSDEFRGHHCGLPMESWVVENVSRGGFGALLKRAPSDWLKVGALIAMQPEGGENWLLGVVRRYHRESETEACVGIETLAQQVTSTELKPRMSSSYAASAGIPGLLLPAVRDELRVVLPLASFDLRESLEFNQGGRPQVLTPVALQEQAGDYEIARYRLKPA